MLSIWGNDYLSNKENRIYVNDLAYEMGFRTGDKILKFDDYEPEDFTMLQADLGAPFREDGDGAPWAGHRAHLH